MVDSESFEVAEVAGERTRLAEWFAPCFVLVLRLRAAENFPDSTTLRATLLDALEDSERNALRAGISRQDVDDAKFALVAFIDESLLSSDWSQKDEWIANPLQLQLYDRFDAGEDFFVRLSELRNSPERMPALEVFYLCMTLGFRGRFQITGRDQLRAIVDEVAAAVDKLPRSRVGALSPNGRPRDQVAAEVKTKVPTWAIIAVAVAVGFLLYLILTAIVENKAGDVQREIEALTAAAITEVHLFPTLEAFHVLDT